MDEKINLQSSNPLGELVMTVSECIVLVNQTLEYAYPTIAVEGEVASFKVNHNNYVFFDLKDDDCTLGCFMMAYQLRMPLEDGMKVRVVAQPKLTKWGKFSLTVRTVIPVGEGALKRAYELQKERLAKEGLFASERKRPLPQYVERIGLVSSRQAAGFADFVKIVSARWPLAQLEVKHCRVQGVEAADDIIAALQELNELSEPSEVIAVVRGGGSADDFACFNDEKLVRAIAASRVPVIAGIGHEVDETLSSLAADVNASTPSNAAELLTPDAQLLSRRLHEQRLRLGDSLRALVREQLQLIVHQRQQLGQHMLRLIETIQHRLQSSRQLLVQLDPQTVLSRGYSVVRSENKVIRDGRELKAGDLLRIETAKAIIESEVKHASEK